MTELPQDIWDAMTRLDFVTFVRRVMSVLEPGTHYEDNWHIHLLAHRLSRLQDSEVKRLMINMPPRSMKTITVSIAFAAWVLGHDPTRRIICVTYSQEVAKAQAVLFGRIVREPWYRRIFPQCRPAVPNRLLEWQTSAGGYRLAASVDGSVLGRGADLIILDDPNKGQEIYSKVMRERVRNAWDHTISTRLNHPKQSAIICVMQRLHADDLAGHLLAQEEWDQVTIPAIAERDERWDLGRGLTRQRLQGELIQPSRMGEEELETQRRRMGLTAFSAQYQQQPVPDDGIVVRKAWLRYYEEAAHNYSLRLASWDTASTLEENADWSVGTVWGLVDQEIHLLHLERARVEAPELIQLIERIHRNHRVDTTLIENDHFGRGVAQHLMRTSKWCHPLLIKPSIDKVARMQVRSAMFETGKVFLPREAPWLAVYLDELLGFPNRRHDDQVDSTSQALDWFQQRFSADITPEVREYRRKRPANRPRPPGRTRTAG